MLLPIGVQRAQSAVLVNVPERPSVARRCSLERGADLVNRSAVRVANDRSIGADRSRPAPLVVRQIGSCWNEAAFDEGPERDARLLTFVRDSAHCAFIERESRFNPLQSDRHISALLLDTD